MHQAAAGVLSHTNIMSPNPGNQSASAQTCAAECLRTTAGTFIRQKSPTSSCFILCETLN